MRGGIKYPGSQNARFWVVFILITMLLLSGALWVIGFIGGTAVAAADEEIALNQAYINYSTSGDYIQPESVAAVQAYIAQYPEPQNVKVLTGLNTSQVWSFMTNFVAGG